MSKPWMPLYVNDYLGDTLDLSAEQHGVYLLLLALSWRRGGSIPNDMVFIKRALSACASDIHGNRFNRLVPPLLERFFTLDEEGNFTNPRLGKEIEKSRNVSIKQKEKAEKRWAKSKENKGMENTTAIPEENYAQMRDFSNFPGLFRPEKSGKSLGKVRETSEKVDVKTKKNNGLSNATAMPPCAQQSQSYREESLSLRSFDSSGPAGPPNERIEKSCVEAFEEPTEADRSAARDAGLSVENFLAEWAGFRDHHLAKGSRLADRSAAWRNWLRKRPQFERQRAGPTEFRNGVGHVIRELGGFGNGRCERNETQIGGNSQNVRLLSEHDASGCGPSASDASGVCGNLATRILASG